MKILFGFFFNVYGFEKLIFSFVKGFAVPIFHPTYNKITLRVKIDFFFHLSISLCFMFYYDDGISLPGNLQVKNQNDDLQEM